MHCTTEQAASKQIISRTDARNQGAKLYFTGKPCSRGHISERRVSNGACIVCHHDDGVVWRKQNVEKSRQLCREYRERNPEYFKAKDAKKIERESPEARERRLQYHRDRYYANHEQYKLIHREYIYRRRAVDPNYERDKSERYRIRNPERRQASSREYNHRRRAIIRGSSAVRFSSLEIYERDSWMCGICGRKVNRNLKFPHPESATLDHIVPLSRGGQHEPSNCQLAHYQCNLHKSNNT